jgi:hypothetical protein
MTKLKYPIFEESAKYTFNKNYKIQLNKFSKGIFPKYISIVDNNFTIKINNKSYSISLNSDSYDILQFYITHFKMKGKSKKHNKLFAFPDETLLKDLNTHYCNSLLINYCEEKKNEWNLKHEQYKQLLAFIHKNLLSGKIKKDKIKVINSKIDNIPIKYKNNTYFIK